MSKYLITALFVIGGIFSSISTSASPEGLKVNNVLYFKSSQFSSNKDLADYFLKEFTKLGFHPEDPIDSDFMYIISTQIDDIRINFYLGKNDEESEPSLWQIWPEQKTSVFSKLLGKVNMEPTEKAQNAIELIVKDIDDATGIKWDI